MVFRIVPFMSRQSPAILPVECNQLIFYGDCDLTNCASMVHELRELLCLAIVCGSLAHKYV